MHQHQVLSLPRRRWRRKGAALLLAAALLVLAAAGAQAQFWFSARPMPEFSNQASSAWINSKPLKRADLAGKVVLIEVWTSI